MNKAATELYEDMKAGRLADFDMGAWQACGTPLCIGGHMEVRAFGVDNFVKGEYLPEERVFEHFGIDYGTGIRLCYPMRGIGPWAAHGGSSPYAATQQEAAEALRRACEMSTLEVIA